MHFFSFLLPLPFTLCSHFAIPPQLRREQTSNVIYSLNGNCRLFSSHNKKKNHTQKNKRNAGGKKDHLPAQQGRSLEMLEKERKKIFRNTKENVKNCAGIIKANPSPRIRGWEQGGVKNAQTKRNTN